MSDYEFLTPENIPGYLKAHPQTHSIVDHSNLVEIQEVGDGNLNLVFIIKDNAGDGIVLKQALPYVRLVGPSWPMSPDRARIEYETTTAHAQAAADLVPLIYFYDNARYIIAMEDLSDHRVWRGALNDGQFHHGSAAAVGEYMAKVLFKTSIFGLGQAAHKFEVARAINPEMSLITEDLVFTEPWYPGDRNSYLPENEPDAIAITKDEFMKLEIGKLKYEFMTNAEALIHGDLHSGSVMVKADESGKSISTKAFDSEFSFYGPVAFDIGAVIANYYIAMARSVALNRNEHLEYLTDLPTQTWNSFESNFRALWPTRKDSRIFSDELLDVIIMKWKVDSLGFACAKMCRRIVGLAKTTDIETLAPNYRIGAARGVLQSAQMIIRERLKNTDISHVTEQVLLILAKTKTV
jgi:5-methylthioribose kinase